MHAPLLSICIPIYNRPYETYLLLESIVAQLPPFLEQVELVLSDNNSTESSAISELVSHYQTSYPDLRLVFNKNEANLGYDANIRKLISLSSGTHLLFYGNDDISPYGSIQEVLGYLSLYPSLGVIVRSYYTFKSDDSVKEQSFRYLKNDKLFEPGLDALLFAYRRSVVLSGLVIHREAALSLNTNHYDGTLLYQLYLVGQISQQYQVLFTQSYLAAYRLGGLPEFGDSSAEPVYTSGSQSFQSSLSFIAGYLQIARHVSPSLGFYHRLLLDLSRYSLPLLSIQCKNRVIPLPYIQGLLVLGLGRSPLFWIYLLSLLFLGKRLTEDFVCLLKKVLGSTPQLTSFDSYENTYCR